MPQHGGLLEDSLTFQVANQSGSMVAASVKPKKAGKAVLIDKVQ